jgi:hypothetical protein
MDKVARILAILAGGALVVREGITAAYVLLPTIAIVGSLWYWQSSLPHHVPMRQRLMAGLVISIGLWLAVGLSFSWSDRSGESAEASTLPITFGGELEPASAIVRHGIISAVAISLVYFGTQYGGTRRHRKRRRRSSASPVEEVQNTP